MQVGAGGTTGGTHISDNLPLRNARALTYTLCKFAQMQVSRYEVTGVLDFKRITASSSPAFECHYTVGYSVYRSASRGSVIDS